MAQVYVIADLHLGHENLIKNKRGFKTVEDHDNLIINNWNKTVNKKDKVYILGDITMENKKNYHILTKLKGNKTVILGNHEKEGLGKELLNYVSNVAGLIKYKNIWLSHAPIHTSELRGKKNIHGHVHENTIILQFSGKPDERYINVSCENINYTPQLISQYF